MARRAQQRNQVEVDPNRRKRRSTEDLITRILETAAEEFKRLGYDGTTTASIARKAEVTEAQIFRYYGSKAALFREAIFKPLDQQLANFTKKHGNTRDATKYIAELRSFLDSNVDMLTSLIALQRYEREEAEGVGAIESLGKYFERGAATMTAEVGEDVTVRPELMVRVSFAAVLACVMFKDWIFPAGLASEAEINHAIVAFVLDGINLNQRETGAQR